MKKVSLVVMEKDREISLEKLREVGVMHLEKKSVSSDTLGKLMERKAKIGTAVGILRRYTVKKDAPIPIIPNGPNDAELIGHILELGDEKKALQEQFLQYAREKRRIEPWGEFDPLSFAFLKEHGVALIPYEIPLKVHAAQSADIKLLVISRDKRVVRALAAGTEIPGQIPFTLPVQSLSQIEESMSAVRARIGGIETELAALAHRKETIEAENKRLLQEIEFETAKAGMETLEDAPAQTAVSWLCGFVPFDHLGALKRSAAEEGWALIWEDVTSGDRPPTLVRNNKMVRIVQPLFSFLGTVPGYREYDISFSFMIFFCLFFAMIFGDAAYGLVLFTLAVAIGAVFKKKSGKFPDAAKLFMLLSFCTIVWGSITGAWFSIPVEKLPRVLRSLIIPPFNNTGPLAQFPLFLQKLFNLPAEVPVDDLKTRWNIQFLCFTVAAIQLVWARSKNIRKLLPSLTALAQAGWLIMMVGLYFLVLFMLLNVALPPFATWLIGGGLAMYFIFSEQNGGNFLKNILKSFSNFLSIFLNAVGSFADIISYIRLFAVGLAGSIIAQSVNSMAIPAEGFGSFGMGFVLRLLAALLILAFGHALNFAMNALSVVVHGVRLNLLEYAGNHLGMEWSGYAYNPFALKQKK